MFLRQHSGRVFRLTHRTSLILSVVLCSAAMEAQRVFAVLSFLMAASTSALCLVFALCWTSQTVHSYSNTRSLLIAGQALYPTTLLLLTMASTGNMAALLMSSASQCYIHLWFTLLKIFWFMHFWPNPLDIISAIAHLKTLQGCRFYRDLSSYLASNCSLLSSKLFSKVHHDSKLNLPPLPLLSPGFFFLLSWCLFTYQHREELCQDFSGLGSSYWLGALGWTLLLVVETIVFIAEQAIVPDILPDLEKAAESWRNSSQHKVAERSFSDSRCSGYS